MTNDQSDTSDLRSQILTMSIGKSHFVAGCKSMRYTASLQIKHNDTQRKCGDVRIYASRRFGQHTRVVGRVRVANQSCVISGNAKEGWKYNLQNRGTTARLGFPWWWRATQKGSLALKFDDGDEYLIRYPWFQTRERVGRIKQAGHTKWSRFWLYVDRTLRDSPSVTFPESDCFQTTTADKTMLLASCALSLSVFPPIIIGGG